MLVTLHFVDGGKEVFVTLPAARVSAMAADLVANPERYAPKPGAVEGIVIGVRT